MLKSHTVKSDRKLAVDTFSTSFVSLAFFHKNMQLTTKMVQNEYSCIDKYSIQGKILILLIRENECLKICISFAVEYT